MHDSMMIADVGGIVNVSGKRIAMPFAAPRPGSTPMMTPSTMPSSIRPMLNGDIATAKPWNRYARSCTRALLRRLDVRAKESGSVPGPPRQIPDTLVERHLAPDLEHEEEDDRDDDCHQHTLQARIRAEETHEERDVDRRCHVDPDELDVEHVDRRGDQHLQHLLELPPLDERLIEAADLAAQRVHEHGEAADADDERHVEREEARLRTFGRPAEAQLVALVDEGRAEEEQQRGHHRLHRARRDDAAAVVAVSACFIHVRGLLSRRERRCARVSRDGRPGKAAVSSLLQQLNAYFFARNPAFSIRPLCIVSASVSHFTYSGPVMNDWLNAACSVNSFQSGVSRTFFRRSMYQLT